MTVVGMDLLPRDAELARRAAGGDGAAFVRLYDHYSTEVFTAALAATGSIEAAAGATQTAFLRVLRWPPPLGAPDGDVAELLCALALGGSIEPTTGRFDNFETEDARDVARLVGVGWLRSETVAKAGARFDDDWSAHLWTAPPAGAGAAGRSARGARRVRRLLDATRGAPAVAGGRRRGARAGALRGAARARSWPAARPIRRRPTRRPRPTSPRSRPKPDEKQRPVRTRRSAAPPGGRTRCCATRPSSRC